MRVLIIDGTRFIGPVVVSSLKNLGHDVLIFHRGEHEDDRTEGVDCIRGDRKRLLDFAGSFKEFKPDVVLDMISFTSEDATQFVDIFKGVASRSVVISSIDVYLAFGRLRNTEPGPPQPVPLKEDSELRKTNRPQGKAYDKLAVERIVGDVPELPATILRLPAVFGPKDTTRRVGAYIKRAYDGRPFILVDEMTAQWRFSRGYVDNVASAIVLAVTMDEAKGRTYNVGEPGTLTELEWYEKSSRGVGWKGEILVIPEVDLPEHLRRGTNLDQHWVVDTSRIREELGFHEIVSQDEGIARAIEWDRSNPPLQFDEERYGKLDYAADDAALEILRARHPDRGLQIYHARKA